MSDITPDDPDPPRRVDEVLSRQTANSSRSLLIVSATAIFAQLFDIRVEQLGGLSTANIDRTTVEAALLITTLYLVYAHVTNWYVDVAAGPHWFDMSNFFGDHQDAYGSGQWIAWGNFRGTITNVWLHLSGAFGYSPWTAMSSLMFLKHLFLPIMLGFIAVCMLTVSIALRQFGTESGPITLPI